MSKKKLSYKDDFELLYLRHEYIKRCKTLDGKFVEEYAPIVNTTARIMYEKLYPNYSKVGFDQEDIVSITNVYMLGFMGLYSLRFNKKKREEYIKDFKKAKGRTPTEREIYNKDKNNMINFLRQRLQHCSTLCARKARNITVGIDRRGFYAHTKDSKSASNESILENYKKLGYRKVTRKEYKECLAKAKQLGERTITDKDGFKIIDIQLLNNGISNEDYELMLETNGGVNTMNPEDILSAVEAEQRLANYKEIFSNMDKTSKRRKLKKFIEDNKDNRYLKEELALARKMLRKSEFMV